MTMCALNKVKGMCGYYEKISKRKMQTKATKTSGGISYKKKGNH